MAKIPDKLALLLAEFATLTEETRFDLLIEYADRFVPVPRKIASQPYPELNKVPGCESEVYLWGVKLEDGTIKYHFAVENPQGISAKALAVILDETLSGAKIDEISAIESDFVYRLFGKSLSMGKGQGLMGMVNMCKYLSGFAS